MTKRTKSNKTCILVFEDNEFKYKCFERFYSFDTVLRKWIKDREETTYETLESRGLTKEPIEIDAIFISERPSQTLMSSAEISFFKGTFRFEIPEIKGFEHAYLYFDEEEKSVSMNVLRPNYSFVIDFNDSKFCELISEPKRISRKEAQKLYDEKKVYPRFLKMHGGIIAIVSYFKIAKP